MPGEKIGSTCPNLSSPFCSVPFPLNLEEDNGHFLQDACSLCVTEEKVARGRRQGSQRLLVIVPYAGIIRNNTVNQLNFKIQQNLEGLIVKRSPLPLSPHFSLDLVKMF